MGGFDEQRYFEASNDELWELACGSEAIPKAQALMVLAQRHAHSHGRDVDNWQRAVTLFDEAIDTWLAADEPREAGIACYHKASVLYVEDQNAEAAEAAAKGIEYLGVAGGDKIIAETLHLQALAHSDLDHTAQAAELFARAREMFEAAGDEISAARCALDYSDHVDDCDRALRSIEFALSIFRRVESPDDIARAQHFLSGALLKYGRPHEALVVARDNVNLARFRGESFTPLPLFLIRHGACLRAVNRPEEALDVLRDAVFRLEQTTWLPKLAMARVELAGCLRDVKRIAEAEEIESMLVAYYRSIGRDDEAASAEVKHLETASCSTSEKRHLSALRSDLKRAAASGDEVALGDAAIALGRVLARCGRSKAALKVFGNRYPTDWSVSRHWAGHTLILVMTALNSGRLEEARGLSQRLLDRTRAEHIPIVDATAHEAAMLVAQALGDLPATARHRREAIALYLLCGRHDEALILAKEDLPRDPVDPREAILDNDLDVPSEVVSATSEPNSEVVEDSISGPGEAQVNNPADPSPQRRPSSLPPSTSSRGES